MTTNQARRDRECAANAAARADYARRVEQMTIPTKTEITPTKAEATRWNRMAGKYAVRTYRNTQFMPWWEALNHELAERGLPETPYREAKDAYEMGQSPETEASEQEAKRTD